MKHDQFDQSSLRREPKYPGPKRIVVDHIVRNMHVLQGVSYVVLGVPALEGRVVDPRWPHSINVTRNFVSFLAQAPAGTVIVTPIDLWQAQALRPWVACVIGHRAPTHRDPPVPRLHGDEQVKFHHLVSIDDVEM